MSRKFTISFSKRAGFVIKASCPDSHRPHPSPSRLQKRQVGGGPDFLSDGIVPGPGMRGICPDWRWLQLLCLLHIRSLFPKRTDLAPLPIVRNGILTHWCVCGGLAMKKHVLWIHPVISWKLSCFSLCWGRRAGSSF